VDLNKKQGMRSCMDENLNFLHEDEEMRFYLMQKRIDEMFVDTKKYSSDSIQSQQNMSFFAYGYLLACLDFDMIPRTKYDEMKYYWDEKMREL
jgi:hypothetical protein